MKHLIRRITLGIFIIQMGWSIGGLGVYYNNDTFSSTPYTSENVTNKSIDNPGGYGVFLYLDILPFIDLEADFEWSNQNYEFTIGDFSGDMEWARVSSYLTVRKKIIGISIPLLAKAQLYGGLGMNFHSTTPLLNETLITKTDPNIDISNFQSDDLTKVIDYATDNMNSNQGFHFQLGTQGKLLMVNAFANIRYTIVKDVIEGKNGFPSLWFGIAYGI